MPKVFAFRLERLLDLRRMREEQKKREFAEANRAVAARQQAIVKLLIEEDATKNELRALKTKELDLAAIRMREHYLGVLGRQISKGYRDLQTLQLAAVARRGELVAATQGVRVLERLKEKKRAEYDLEVSREEQKFLDEVAARMGPEGV